MFGDIKFVCMGGTSKRMKQFAFYIMDQIDYKLPPGAILKDISLESYRYSMYKVGPVLCVSHGMGIPSIGILLHEVIKLMHHAQCKDPIFFRLGTCGGIGIEGGNLIVSEEAVDGLMKPYLEQPVLGEIQRRPALLDMNIVEELKNLTFLDDPFTITTGKTMCTTDFYEGQGRLNGAFCEYTEKQKVSYLNEIQQKGIVNMEMESLSFAALCHHAGIKSAIICVSLVNRLNEDQISKPKLVEWQEYPQILVARFIKKKLGIPLNMPPRQQPYEKKNSLRRNKSTTIE